MKLVKSLTYLFAFLVLTVNCIDQDFDEPPIGGEDPDLTATMTIAELKALHVAGQDNNPIVLTDDDIIKGVCNSSDESGNIFKQITIQDETGGILIRIDRSDSYTEFAPGRNIFVKVKDLALGDFNGTYQLGKISGDGTGTDRIPDALIDQHVIPGRYNQPLEAKVKTIPDLDFNADQNTLVVLENVEFVDYTATYGVVGNGSTQNRSIKDCNNNEITMRNSDFATFAGSPSPTGKVNMTGIFSTFGSTKQFTIRDLTDVVQVDEARCDGNVVGGSGVDPDLDVTMTIAELKAMHVAGVDNAPTIITGDEVIKGVAVSSDQTGNFFKQLIIQDETGGIEIRMDRNDLFTRYEVGTNVFVKLKDLAVGDFNGNYQIGVKNGDNTDRIPDGQINTLVLPGLKNQDIPTNSKSIADLDLNRDQNTLVTLSGVEFGASFLSSSYADADFSKNVDVLDCDNNLAVLRTSNFSDFGATTVAQGNGTLTAVFTVFGTTKQLLIRDLSDVNFNGDRCDGGTVGGGDEELMTIADLKSAGSAPSSRKISGTVISDWQSGNTTGRNIHLQDASGGIAIRFSANHSFALNSEIEVIVSNVSVGEFGGLTQIEVPLANGSQTGTGSGPTPLLTTISDIKSMTTTLESTLIKLEGVTLSGESTFGGNLTVTQGGESLSMFTRNQATFEGDAIPTGAVDLTAVVTLFNDEAQIFIRNLDDVE